MTRQCPAFTELRPITGRRLSAPRGATGHRSAGGKPGLRAAICSHPRAGRTSLRWRPTRRRGLAAAGAAACPWGRGRAQGQHAPPPPAGTRRCPFKAGLLPGLRSASAASPRGAATSGLPGGQRRWPLGPLLVPAGRQAGRGWGAPPGRKGPIGAT